MPSKSTKKSALQYLGLGLFAISLLVFTAMLGLDDYKFSEELILDERLFNKLTSRLPERKPGSLPSHLAPPLLPRKS